MVPKPYGVGYLAFYPLITYCFYTVVPLLAHGTAISQIYCLLFPFWLSKTKTGVITHKFTVRTSSELVLSFTSNEEPRTGPISGLVNLDWTEPEPLVRFKGSRFEPRFRTELRQPYCNTKYTEAIAKDQSNAVLYANRAACCLAMKKCWTLETLLPRRRLNYFL